MEEKMVEIKRLREGAVIPTYGSAQAACCDLYACIDAPIMVNPHETVMIGTGLAIKPPAGHYGAIYARSGMATKKGLRPANCVGICDEDYRGEYIVALHNDCDICRTIEPGDRIAQLMFVSYQQFELCEVEELDETERGAGGFGSTGTK